MKIELTKMLEAWNRKIIQSGIQLNKRLSENGLTWGDVEAWIKENPTVEQSRKNGKPVKALRRACPTCRKPMNGSNLYSESEKYKEGFRSYWICGASCCKDKGCGYEEFSKKTVKELIGGKNG